MARPLMLKVTVDDKGNPVLATMSTNVNRLNKNTKGLGKTLTHVFASAVMLQALNKFKMGIAAANKEVFEFNKTFKQIEGITGTSGKALDILKKKTLDVSNTTEHASTAIAKAVLSISKMGFTLEQSLAVVPHVADLATSSIVELDEATRVAVQTMKSYQMEASDMEHIVNTIQGTVSKTAINFDEFSQSMKFVAPIAQALNINLEETSAMIGKLGDVGIKGSLAGTTLKNMFLNIMKPSNDVRAILKNLNVEGKGFNEILKAMNKVGIPISSFLETFNKRAIAGSLALAEMTDATDELREALEREDVKVKDVADKIREAWIPQLEMLRNTFVNVFVVMGKILDDSDLGLGIEGISQKFIDLQGWLEKNPEAVIRVAKEIAKLTEGLVKLASDAFTFVIKNGDVLYGLFKTMLALGIATRVGTGYTNAFMRFDKAVGNAGKSMAIALPILHSMAIAIQLASSWTDKWVENLERVQKVTGDISVQGLENKLEALKEFQKRMSDPDEVKFINKVKKAGKGVLETVKELESNAEILNRVSKDIGKDFGIDPAFFKGLSKVDAMIVGLEKRIASMKKGGDKESGKESDAVVPFNLEDLFGKGGKGGAAKDPAEEYADAFIKYMELRLKGKSEVIARALAGFSLDAAKLLGQGETIGGLTGGQIGGLGKLTPGFEASLAGTEATGLPLNIADIPNLSAQAESAIKLAAEEVKILQIQKERIEIIDKLIDKHGEEIEAIELVKEKQQEAVEVERAIAEERKEHWLNQAEGFMSAAQLAVDMVQMIQDAQFSKLKSHHADEMKMLDARAKREIDNVQGNAFKTAIVARKMAKEKQKLEAEQAKIEKEQKEKQRRWAMIEVAINTAVGITQALRGMVPPASIVMAAIVGAMGFAQLGLISSQESFRVGGYTGSGNPSDIAGVVHRKEFVVKDQDVRDLGGASGVQQMIEDRLEGETTNRVVYMNIDTFIGTEEFKRELFIDMQKEAQRWQ